jgi:hypothetical protein
MMPVFPGCQLGHVRPILSAPVGRLSDPASLSASAFFTERIGWHCNLAGDWKQLSEQPSSGAIRVLAPVTCASIQLSWCSPPVATCPPRHQDFVLVVCKPLSVFSTI